MLTLKELKIMVNPVGDANYLTPKMLRERNGKVIARRDIGDSCLLVYEDGFVLYQSGRHATVFSLNCKEEYSYDHGSEVTRLEAAFFEDKPWYVRLILEAEDRIARNQTERERSISYEAAAEDWSVMTDENAFVERDVLRREKIREIFAVMTDRQKDCVYRYFFLQETYEEIGEILGMSKAAARKNVLAGIARCRKVLGKDFPEGWDNE